MPFWCDEETGAVSVFLLTVDYPQTVALLAAIVETPIVPKVYDPLHDGVWVCWEMLAASHLSTGEKAAVVVAKGVAALERSGGLSGHLAEAVHDAVAALAPYPQMVTAVTKR